MQTNWIVVYTSDQIHKVILAKQRLEAEGIQAVEVNKKDSSFNSFGEIELSVEIHNAEKAKNILKELQD